MMLGKTSSELSACALWGGGYSHSAHLVGGGILSPDQKEVPPPLGQRGHDQWESLKGLPRADLPSVAESCRFKVL